MSTARVDFTRGAAERIAAVVRRVEQGDRDGAPLTFRRVNDLLPGSPLRLGVFTEDWPTGATMTVTLYGVTSTANTATVINLSAPILGFTNTDSTSQFVVFGKARGTTEAVAVELQQLEGCLFVAGHDLSRIANFKAGEVQILGHNENEPACLKWFDVHTCPATSA